MNLFYIPTNKWETNSEFSCQCGKHTFSIEFVKHCVDEDRCIHCNSGPLIMITRHRRIYVNVDGFRRQ